jgi:hypothetical protein
MRLRKAGNVYRESQFFGFFSVPVLKTKDYIFPGRPFVTDMKLTSLRRLFVVLILIFCLGAVFLAGFPSLISAFYRSDNSCSTCTNVVEVAAQKYAIGSENQTEQITITYLGGQSAPFLTGFSILVNDQNTSADLGLIPGTHVTVPGTTGKDHIVITGHFGSRGKQVVNDNILDNALWIRKQGDTIFITNIGSRLDDGVVNYSVDINNGILPVELSPIHGSNITVHGSSGKDHIIVRTMWQYNITSVFVDIFVE